MVDSGEWETPCPVRDDRQHCNCWYDGEACCGCGDLPLLPEQLEGPA
jgi:hypothetical protein